MAILTPERPLVLASASPRRRDLLALTGLAFEAVSPKADEGIGGPPARRVMALARRKAEAAFAMGYQDRLILAADTLVARRGQVLGKPESREDAARMLRLLSGGWHEVYTGVCLMEGASGRMETACDKTRVRFIKLDEEWIRRYVATGEPMDKAGSYAIQGQGGLLVERIRGSASNVIGLPLALVGRMLGQFGVSVL